jgi:ElaB/YqjD/DUF883 family membrane-anchored ribosome-binding protein
VAKKAPARGNASRAKQPAEEANQAAPGAFESLGRKLDDIPQVRAAEAALHKARVELQNAQSTYESVRQQAVEGFTDLRQKKVGELAEDSLDFVRRHPGVGLTLAAIVGYLLGRVFRR